MSEQNNSGRASVILGDCSGNARALLTHQYRCDDCGAVIPTISDKGVAAVCPHCLGFAYRVEREPRGTDHGDIFHAELDRGKALAAALVDHLVNDMGAGACLITVGEYEVIVKPTGIVPPVKG